MKLKKRKNQIRFKKKLVFGLTLIILMMLGIGYSFLVANLNIKGNIVMKNIPCDNIKNRVDYEKMKRGLFLNYNTDLSAIPFSNRYNVEESKTELPLLMFNINEKTKMLD